MSESQKLGQVIFDLETNGGTKTLEGGLIMRVETVGRLACLHVGRDGVEPSSVELDVLAKAIEYQYRADFVIVSSGVVRFGKYMKCFLYWPLVGGFKIARKRPLQRKLI